MGAITASRNAVCLLFALGCPRSKAETARLVPYLQLNGWRLTERVERADVVLVACCGFNDKAEDESVRFLQTVSPRLRPEAKLIVLGCLGGINPDRIRRATGPCEIIPPVEIRSLDRVLDSAVPLESVGEVNDFDPVIHPLHRPLRRRTHRPWWQCCWPPRALGRRAVGRWRRWRYPKPEQAPGERVFHIRIARGCLSECTYCAIRFACGPLVSRPLESIVGEFRLGLRRGFGRFELIAGDVGAYGMDRGSDLPALLGALLEHEGDYRVDLLDVHPQWLIRHRQGILDALHRWPGHLGTVLVPLQSGSDTVLQRMKREHTVADALDALRALMAAAPEARVETHVMVGFPGETEEDFQRTLDALDALPYHRIVPYGYCHRPRTVAATLPDQVDPARIAARVATVRRRYAALIRW